MPGTRTRPLKVMSNMYSLGDVRTDGYDLEFRRYTHDALGFFARLRLLLSALSCDYAVINCAPRDLYLLAQLKTLLPFSRCRIVSLDTVLPVPHDNTWRHRLALRIKRRLFKRVHLFIEYFRQTEGYERHYEIPRSRFRYVPFKVNRYDRILRTPRSDQGYVFCGGNTRRDFATLIAACHGLECPVTIVTMSDGVIAGHGSSLDERSLPPNVTVVRHDGSDSFLDYIAGARLVVLPIRKENISASGIGVYLASMALGKCVVISDGPAVRDVVPEGAAIVVPPEDPDALRAAISTAWSDRALRDRVAGAGQEYALGLGGEERLAGSVMDVLIEDMVSRSRSETGRS